MLCIINIFTNKQELRHTDCIMPLPPAPALRLSPSQHLELMKITDHPSTPQAIVLRCRVVLGAAKGIANNELARQLSTSLPTVLLWRRRFQQQGWLAILEDKHRSGRPRSLTPEKEAAIVETTRNTKPPNATHWSVRSMARSQGVSSATIQRIWKAYHLQPHRVEHFKFSTDPEFVRKVRDIVGLYLNPPDQAVVFSLDEKSQIQALDRTQPILPLRPGLPERQTHDYRTPWNDHSVRGPERLRGNCDRTLPTQAPSPRVPHFSRAIRCIPDRSRAECAHHPGQLRNTQAPRGEKMVRCPSPLSHSLHSHRIILVESD